MRSVISGQEFEVVYPFIRDTVSLISEGDGTWDIADVETWRPGTRNEADGPEGVLVMADGLGRMVVTVVSTHKPGHYPLRVFYTRRWVDPDGKSFGKPACRVKTLGAFSNMAGGFRYDFVLKGCKCDGCERLDDHRKQGFSQPAAAA